MATQVRNNFVSAVIGMAAVVGILVVLGMAISNRDSSGGDDRDDTRMEAEFMVLWGQLREDGVFQETGRPKIIYECVERHLSITIFIDGENLPMDQYDSQAEEGERCTFRTTVEVRLGTELGLRVEELEGDGGYKMCSISTHGMIVPPNGWGTAGSNDPCEVWGLAV